MTNEKDNCIDENICENFPDARERTDNDTQSIAEPTGATSINLIPEESSIELIS